MTKTKPELDADRLVIWFVIRARHLSSHIPFSARRTTDFSTAILFPYENELCATGLKRFQLPAAGTKLKSARHREANETLRPDYVRRQSVHENARSNRGKKCCQN